jgi:hypothetical protein
MLLGGLIIAPMLSYMSTGLKVGKEVYEDRMYEFYAADAGVEDALWYLQSDERLGERFDESNYESDPANWTPDDIDWPIPEYHLAPINEKDVAVTIDRAWLLGKLGYSLPVEEPAEGSSGNANDHWTVMGALNMDDTSYYIVDITTNESASTGVDHIGVWLPQGYSYVTDSVKINGVAKGGPGTNWDLVNNPDEQPPYRGGTALIWDYSGTQFEQLSDIAPPSGGQTPVEKFPPSIRLSFKYTVTPFKEARGFFPWIKLVDDRIAWDTEAGFYHVVSLGKTSDTKYTTVETYTPRSVVRYTSGSGGVASAIKGDYIVIGNSLMTCCWNKVGSNPCQTGPPCGTTCNYCGDNPYRNYAPPPDTFSTQIDGERESYATVNSSGADAVPSDAKIERAYLYWTAWLRGDWLWTESGQSWNPTWTTYMGNDVNWEAKAPQNVKDWLKVNAYDGKAYLQVNTTKVTPKNAGDPLGTVLADKWYISEGSNNVQPSYQYACFADVTAQVTAITTTARGAKFTVAGVHAHPATSPSSPTNDWNRSANAGWSLIIIYSSVEKETHQIYLYAGCDHLWGSSGSPDTREFTIAGFEAPTDLESGETNEAKMTVFASEGDATQAEYLRFKGQNTIYYDLYDVSGTLYVFNSMSSTSGFTRSDISGQPTGQISGIDIDTYTRTRPSGGTPLSAIVKEGNTWAKINVGSTGDGFELIYVVFSVRSTKIPAGGAEFEVGTMTYQIK